MENAERLKVPYLRVPGGMPPRAALPYLFVPLLICLEKLGLAEGASEELNEALKLLEEISKDNSPDKPSKRKLFQNLSLKHRSKPPLQFTDLVFIAV